MAITAGGFYVSLAGAGRPLAIFFFYFAIDIFSQVVLWSVARWRAALRQVLESLKPLEREPPTSQRQRTTIGATRNWSERR